MVFFASVRFFLGFACLRFLRILSRPMLVLLPSPPSDPRRTLLRRPVAHSPTSRIALARPLPFARSALCGRLLARAAPATHLRSRRSRAPRPDSAPSHALTAGTLPPPRLPRSPSARPQTQPLHLRRRPVSSLPPSSSTYSVLLGVIELYLRPLRSSLAIPGLRSLLASGDGESRLVAVRGLVRTDWSPSPLSHRWPRPRDGCAARARRRGAGRVGSRPRHGGARRRVVGQAKMANRASRRCRASFDAANDPTCVSEYQNSKSETDVDVDYNSWYSRQDFLEGEDGELSWFNAGVRVGVGIVLGIYAGVGLSVGLLVRTYQSTSRNFRQRLP